MMRFRAGDPAPFRPVHLDGTTDNAAFFQAAFAGLRTRGLPPEMPLLLLVGGADWRSLAVRAAQAALRLDRQPSFWSHAAVLLDWSDVGRAAGAEVSLDPAQPARQVPERNGATRFELSRYLDDGQYPHLAVVGFLPSAGTVTPAARGRDVRDAAMAPNRDRIRFPFWDQLAGWVRYLYDAGGCPNPLMQNIPHPGASFCEYAFEAGGIDLTPNATGPQACPELFWAAALHWAGMQAEAGVASHVYVREGERHVFTREALPPDLVHEFDRRS